VGSVLTFHIIKVFSNVILAKLLSPESFGLAYLATVIGTGLEMASDIGIGPNFIQHRHGDDPRFHNTAWTIQLLRSLMIAAALVLLAVPISRVYQDARLAKILVLSGGVAVISGFNSTALYTLDRRLAFRQSSILRILGDVVSTGATIISALMTPTVWAIIIGGYVAAIFRLVASHWINTGVPNRFCWDTDSRRELLVFGKWVLVSTAITFFANQTDRLLLGRLESLELLGVYGLALTVATVPQMFGQRMATMVLFPLLAKQARMDIAQLEPKLLRARRVVLSAGLVTVLGVMLASPWFFRVLYDQRYAAAGWITQILCVYMWFSGLQLSADRALLAMGDARSLALSNGVNVVVTVLGCIAGQILGGLLGFTIGLCFSTLASHVVIQIALARRGIDIVGQDAVYTSSLLTLGIIGALGPRVMSASGWAEPSLEMSLALGGPILLGTGGWALWIARHEMLKR
jgi:O-antigen/teichoic acid export membrane protein